MFERRRSVPLTGGRGSSGSANPCSSFRNPMPTSWPRSFAASGPSSRWHPSPWIRSDSRSSGGEPSRAGPRKHVVATRSEGGPSRRKPLGPAGFRVLRMGRIGTAIGLFIPVVLLAVNAGLGYGGILVTAVLLVWIPTGILLTPTPDDER